MPEWITGIHNDPRLELIFSNRRGYLERRPAVLTSHPESCLTWLRILRQNRFVNGYSSGRQANADRRAEGLCPDIPSPDCPSAALLKEKVSPRFGLFPLSGIFFFTSLSIREQGISVRMIAAC